MIRQKSRLAVYAFTHFAVDMCCFYVLYSSVINSSNAALLILLYNALAFALQAPIGAIGDRLDDTVALAVLGAGLVAFGVLAKSFFVISVILLGLGNALFHVGGALSCLRHRPGDALYAGIFVAPGALGTATGLLCADSGTLSGASSLVIILICVLAMTASGNSPARSCERFPPQDDKAPYAATVAAVMLCLISIAIRSFAGFSVKSIGLVLIGGICAFTGKLFGGIINRRLRADVLSLIGVGVGGLMMAFFGGTGLVYVGILLFNLAMPLTLAAVMRALPHHEGLGFGLTTLALFMGWLPLVCFESGWCAPQWLMALLTLGAAVMLFMALHPRKHTLTIDASDDGIPSNEFQTSASIKQTEDTDNETDS